MRMAYIEDMKPSMDVQGGIEADSMWLCQAAKSRRKARQQQAQHACSRCDHKTERCHSICRPYGLCDGR